MFGKKKKKIVNEVFGEMTRWGIEWKPTVKIDIALWDKIYSTEISVTARTVDHIINEKQEKAYLYFKETILERQKEIEEIIKEQYQIKDVQLLSVKFTPTELLFGEKGECALFLDDNDEAYGPYDDHDVGLVISIIPELKIFTQEEYIGYVYGGGCL